MENFLKRATVFVVAICIGLSAPRVCAMGDGGGSGGRSVFSWPVIAGLAGLVGLGGYGIAKIIEKKAEDIMGEDSIAEIINSVVDLASVHEAEKRFLAEAPFLKVSLTKGQKKEIDDFLALKMDKDAAIAMLEKEFRLGSFYDNSTIKPVISKMRYLVYRLLVMLNVGKESFGGLDDLVARARGRYYFALYQAKYENGYWHFDYEDRDGSSYLADSMFEVYVGCLNFLLRDLLFLYFLRNEDFCRRYFVVGKYLDPKACRLISRGYEEVAWFRDYNYLKHDGPQWLCFLELCVVAGYHKFFNLDVINEFDDSYYGNHEERLRLPDGSMAYLLRFGEEKELQDYLSQEWLNTLILILGNLYDIGSYTGVCYGALCENEDLGKDTVVAYIKKLDTAIKKWVVGTHKKYGGYPAWIHARAVNFFYDEVLDLPGGTIFDAVFRQKRFSMQDKFEILSALVESKKLFENSAEGKEKAEVEFWADALMAFCDTESDTCCCDFFDCLVKQVDLDKILCPALLSSSHKLRKLFIDRFLPMVFKKVACAGKMNPFDGCDEETVNDFMTKVRGGNCDESLVEYFEECSAKRILAVRLGDVQKNVATTEDLDLQIKALQKKRDEVFLSGAKAVTMAMELNNASLTTIAKEFSKLFEKLWAKPEYVRLMRKSFDEKALAVLGTNLKKIPQELWCEFAPIDTQNLTLVESQEVEKKRSRIIKPNMVVHFSGCKCDLLCKKLERKWSLMKQKTGPAIKMPEVKK